jgi:hypothetical protein
VIRPYAAPEQTDRDARLFDRLGAALQHDGRGGRIHLSPELHLDHGLMLKQGTLRNLPVTMDKQPLAPERSQRFIQRAAGRSRAREGNATLSVGSGWRLLDLMSARFYVLEKDQGLAVLMAKLAESVNGEVRRVVAGGRYVVFERSAERWIPRAHVAPLQRVVANGEEALDAVSSPGFDPQREIVIESPPDASLPDAASREDVADFEGSARIVIDEPERVVIETETNAPGLLLLTDAYFPGWQASVDGIDTPILHANYLSRAVPITAGRSRVEFAYAPASFGTGLLISGASGCLLIALASATAYRNHRGGSG